MKRVDLSGKRFGRLIVLKTYFSKEKNKTVNDCICDCGSKKTINSQPLQLGVTTSCGCYHKDVQRKRLTTHGLTCRSKKKPIEYNTWASMKDRCHNPEAPRYCDYGGRGIIVCDRWRNSFEAFLEDMGKRPSPKLSLDRIDNNGNYEPGNCRWVTQKEQCCNTRKNIYIDYLGRRKTISDWGQELGCTNGSAIIYMLKTNTFQEIFNYYTQRKQGKHKYVCIKTWKKNLQPA